MPIYHQCEPRSQEWFERRLGIVTSSDFHRILTPKTLKVSSQAHSYMCRLLSEWITGEQIEGYQSEYMIRGQELEDDAFRAYEMLTDAETSPGGFVTTDDGMIGCSPDRLIGENGDLELKCLALQTQIGVALSGLDDEYKCQVQGRLMIHERDYVDLFLYHPRLSLPPFRTYRDDKFIAVLRPLLSAFVETMLEARRILEERYGPFPRPQSSQPDEIGSLGVSDAEVEQILAMQAKERDECGSR